MARPWTCASPATRHTVSEHPDSSLSFISCRYATCSTAYWAARLAHHHPQPAVSSCHLAPNRHPELQLHAALRQALRVAALLTTPAWWLGPRPTERPWQQSRRSRSPCSSSRNRVMVKQPTSAVPVAWAGTRALGQQQSVTRPKLWTSVATYGACMQVS